VFQTTVPWSPEQNGVSERRNRTLCESARSMLFDAELPTKYWGEAVMTACYIQNCLPTKAAMKTPYELWNGKKPELQHIKVFRTDHAALQWLRRTPEPIGQQGRWLEILEEFHFSVEHRPGARHGNADALSRRPCRQCGVCGLDDSSVEVSQNVCTINSSVPPQWSAATISGEQRDDPDIGPIYTALQDGSGKPAWETMLPMSQDTKVYWTQWDSLVLLDAVLYRRYTRGVGRNEVLQLVTPPCYRDEILRLAHAGFTGGHMGERRTLEQVRRRAYWAGWAADTKRMLRSCPACCSYKRGSPPRQGQLQQMNTGMPWERVGVDITGPHPKSKNGFVYILTLIDYFSKWAEAFPIRNQEARTVAKVLVDRVFSHFGSPVQILTDRGTNFESELFSELCRCLQIDHIRTTAYKPSTNGMVERFHRTLNSILGKVVADNQRDWDQHLPYAVAAYRATIHESTGYSPNFLFLGREVRAPLDIVMGLPAAELHSSTSIDFYVDQQLQVMREAYRTVRDRLKAAANRQKHYYDMRVRETKYRPGDLVWLWSPRRKQGRKLKWQRCYTGPYTVLCQIGPVNYRIKKSAKAKPITVHVDKLKPYLVTPNNDSEESQLANRGERIHDREDSNPPEVEAEVDSLGDVESDESLEPRRLLPSRQRRRPLRYQE
jgi:transposase InsO family protein